MIGMGKNALVIAGGQWQVPIITYLKQNGYHVTVADPYTTSKGVLISDEQIQEDVREKDVILNKINRDLDIVCTDQSDISVETVAYIAEKLSLKGNREDVVVKFSNKYLSRKYAKRVNIPIPSFSEVSNLEEIRAFIKEVGLPLMIKPCDAQSSKGIHKIEEGVTDEELEVYLKDALKYSFIKKAILEQFITGYEITVEGFCAQGKHRVLAISRKKHFKTGIASTLTYPALLPPDIESGVIEADNRYVDNSGLLFGPTHAEYIVNEKTGKFYLVEIACRGGGTLISSDIVKWVSGFDVYDAYLKCLEGNFVDVYENPITQKSAELHFFEFGSGKIQSLEGVEEASKLEGVLMLDFKYKVGDVLKSCEDDRSRQGFVIVLADNPNQLQERIDSVCETLKVKLSHE